MKKISLASFLFIVFTASYASNLSYCPDPVNIQKNINTLLSLNSGDWKDKYSRKWEVSIAVDKSETIEPRFVNALTWNFPGIEEGTFVSCVYQFSEKRKGSVTLTSLFKLLEMPKGKKWTDGQGGAECDVDPFDDSGQKSGNILDCPFRISPEKPEYVNPD